MRECKFFECTAVFPLIIDLCKSMYDNFERYDRVDQRLAFLPAEQVWIEYEYLSMYGIFDERPVNELTPITDEDVAKKSPYKYRVAHVFLGDHGSTHLARRHVIFYEVPRLSGQRRGIAHRCHWCIPG